MAAMWPPIIGLLLLLLPIAPSSSIKFPLEGNVYPVGHFYATLNIGDPAKPYFLDVDTGSNLTWLECHHPAHGCKGCHPGDGKTCLAIRDASSDPVLKELNFILIGAVTMQDLFVIYNNESKQLGWVRAQCDKAQELESVIDSRL